MRRRDPLTQPSRARLSRRRYSKRMAAAWLALDNWVRERMSIRSRPNVCPWCSAGLAAWSAIVLITAFIVSSCPVRISSGWAAFHPGAADVTVISSGWAESHPGAADCSRAGLIAKCCLVHGCTPFGCTPCLNAISVKRRFSASSCCRRASSRARHSRRFRYALVSGGRPALASLHIQARSPMGLRTRRSVFF